MKLTKVEDFGNRPYLVPDDECCYLREFTSQKGYSLSEANRLISNLKKPMDRRGRPEWAYKVGAIEQCAEDFAVAPKRRGSKPHDWLMEWTLTAVPPSKAIGDAAYDDRMEQVVGRFVAHTGLALDARPLVRQRVSMPAAHESGQRPKVDELKAAYDVLPPAPRSAGILLFDDVLTQGAHFRACKDVLQAAFPRVRVVGLFIAKAVREKDPLGDVLAALGFTKVSRS